METIDTSHRLETRKEQLDLPAPKVQMLLEGVKKETLSVLDLDEAEQNTLMLARMFGVSDEITLNRLFKDRRDANKISVFARVHDGKVRGAKHHAANDERMSLAA